MPRRKTEQDDETTSVKRRSRAAADAGEQTEQSQERPSAAEDGGEEAQVKKRRTSVRKTSEAGEAEKPRRGRRKKEESPSAPPAEAGAPEEEHKPIKRGRRTKDQESRQETIFDAAESEEPAMSEQPQQQEAACESETAEEAPAAETKTVESEARAETAETALSSTAADEPQPEAARNERGQIRHQHPKLGFNQLAGETLAELRKIAKDTGVSSITTRRKDDLINDILKTQAEALGYRYNGGTLECMPEGYGFLRPSGLLPSSNDIYVSASQIRRFGLRNGDVVWGIIRPPKDQEHYEALLRVENVNFTDPEEARRRPHFEALTPIFPDEKLQLETDRRQIATRIVDIFAPIGKGQRALIVSPPKAGKTTLLKSLAHSITTNHPEVILMVLLIDERPEEVTDMARSVDGEIIASTFDRPAEEHLRVAGLALEKAKRLVEVSKDVVLLLDSITRLARASNLVVPPSGRTLSGGMDPAALYFPKKFFGAARNIENGGSLTIIGTSLVETGSRMDDVIYEEFKGTGNMEVHLSRKIAEQRIFPALDITKSGTRKEELMVPEADLQRIWSLRRKIANMDEAEVLNLILDKLRNTPTNRDFLATIKVG